MLDLVEFRGSRANNIVAPLVEQQSMQGATVLRDERAAAEERYKLWTKFQPTDEERAQGVEPGLWAMHSADGCTGSTIQTSRIRRGRWATRRICFSGTTGLNCTWAIRG